MHLLISITVDVKHIIIIMSNNCHSGFIAMEGNMMDLYGNVLASITLDFTQYLPLNKRYMFISHLINSNGRNEIMIDM